MSEGQKETMSKSQDNQAAGKDADVGGDFEGEVSSGSETARPFSPAALQTDEIGGSGIQASALPQSAFSLKRRCILSNREYLAKKERYEEDKEKGAVMRKASDEELAALHKEVEKAREDTATLIKEFKDRTLKEWLMSHLDEVFPDTEKGRVCFKTFQYFLQKLRQKVGPHVALTKEHLYVYITAFFDFVNKETEN